MKIFPIILFLIFAPSVFAQVDNLDKMSITELDSTMLALYEQGRYMEAIPFAQKSADKAQVIHDSLLAPKLDHLGVLYRDIGQYEKAIGLFQKSMALYVKTIGKENSKYADCINGLGILYSKLGLYDKTEHLYFEASVIRKKVLGETSPDYAQSVNNLANLYMQIGKSEKAEINFLKAIEIWKNIGATTAVDYAIGLANLALFYVEQKRYEEAEPLYEEAQSIYEKTLGKNNYNYAVLLNNQSNLYQNLGQLFLSKRLANESIAILEKTLGAEHPELAFAYNNLAALYSSTNEYELAERAYKYAIELAAKGLGTNHYYYGTCQNNLAALYTSKNLHEKALPLYIAASDNWKATLGTHSNSYITSLNNISNCYYRTDDYAKAFSYLHEAIFYNSISRDSVLLKGIEHHGYSIYPITTIKLLPQLQYNEKQRISHSLSQYGWLLKEIGLIKQDSTYMQTALQIITAALEINTAIRNDFGSDKDKLKNLSKAKALVNDAINIGFKLYGNKEAATLFSYAELNKSVLLTDVIKGNQARILGDLPDSLIFQETVLQKESSKLQKAVLAAQTAEEKQKAIKENNALNLKIENFKKSIKNLYPKYHALKYENITAKAADIQALLEKQTLFLEYFMADSTAYLFAIDKENIAIFALPVSPNMISSKIAILRNALTNYPKLAENYSNFAFSSYWFYTNLLKPALESPVFKKAQHQSLIIVADGELGHLPFEVFLTKQASQLATDYRKLNYLVKDYNVSYNYSATLFVETKQNLDLNKNTHVNQGKILALAGDYKLQPRADVQRPANLRQLRNDLIELPAAEAEVTALSNIFSGMFLKGADANEAFLKSNTDAYSVIHLAMHGLLNNDYPLLSSMVFSENNDSLEDNFLQAFEIAHLKLHADLVVLSACETGFGKFQQGEGVMSLARSFMYAGVPSLVVSLWQVNDQSTAVLMQSFYQYLADGKPKDEALRQAKLDYLNMAEGLAAHPAFWSAFIQLGDNRAITLKQKNSWIGWMIGGLVLLVIGIVVMKQKRGSA